MNIFMSYVSLNSKKRIQTQTQWAIFICVVDLIISQLTSGELRGVKKAAVGLVRLLNVPRALIPGTDMI